MEFRRIMAIVNYQFGMRRVRKCYEKLIKWRDGPAKKKGIELDIEFTEKFGEKNATNLAKKAVRGNYDLIIVFGGDGTANEVANGVVGSDVPILSIQAGGANDFARALGIPKDIEKALNLIFQGRIELVDLGRVVWKSDSRFFINVFSIGLDARINKFANGFKDKFRFLHFLPLFGKGMYLLAALIELILHLHLEYPEVEIRMPGIHIDEPNKMTLIAMANGPRYGGIFNIAPQAKMDDGMLDVCRVKKMGRLRLLLNIPRLYQGTHLILPEVETLFDGRLPRVSSISISSSEDLISQMDGEPLELGNEFQVSIIPNGLKVLVP